MSVTIGEIVARTLTGLGPLPVYWCSLSDVHNAVVRQLSKRVAQTRLSDVNVLIATSREFSPEAGVPLNITNLIENGTPAFVEQLISDGNFQPVTLINISRLAEHKESRTLACAFYREEAAPGAPAKHFVEFSIAPSGVCRIRFDREGVAKMLDDLSNLPEAASELVVLEAQNQLIPHIKTKIGLSRFRSESENKDFQIIIDGLNSVYAHNAGEIRNWESILAAWAYRDRGSQSNRRRRVPSGRGFYG